MGNISLYLEACSALGESTLARTAAPPHFPPPLTFPPFLPSPLLLGVPSYDCFRTVDLWEAKDLKQVVRNLHSLGRIAQSVNGFSGPHLGAKIATKNERQFTEAQLAEARAMPARWKNVGKSLKKIGAAGALAGGGAPAATP